MFGRLIMTAFVLGLTVTPATSGAISLFHSDSDDGSNRFSDLEAAGPHRVPAGGGDTVHLWLGPTDEAGGGIFGFGALNITSTGSLTFSFTCVDQANNNEECKVGTDTPTEVELAGGNNEPGNFAAFKVGNIGVNTDGQAGDKIMINSGNFLDGGGTERTTIPPTVLVVIRGCGDDLVDTGEVCDGNSGCSSDESCNADCSACQIVEEAGELSKAQQKCVNTANKTAQKVSDALGKDITSCIKNFAKGKTGSAATCSSSDPKGKVAKAESKVDSKVGADCAGGSGFVGLADATALKSAARGKELNIVAKLFGSSFDAAIVIEETNKADSKCQQRVAKAVFKCEATKWKEYNSCKKNKLKGKNTSQATTKLELQDACMGTGSEGIPDPKGKIGKKCQTGIKSAIDKKCTNLDLFPGCASPGTSTNLTSCLNAIIECELCKALNAIDGLNRNCDQLDDGTVNGSCQ